MSEVIPYDGAKKLMHLVEDVEMTKEKLAEIVKAIMTRFAS